MVDDAFGNWLAGFIDGEGSFLILRGKGGVGYLCRFSLSVRADDRPILDEILAKTGIGTIHRKPARAGAHESAVWAVGSKLDCLALVSLLDRYPLRAKKRRDYEVWRRAVYRWQDVRRVGLGRGRGTAPSDWTGWPALFTELREVRSANRL